MALRQYGPGRLAFFLYSHLRACYLRYIRAAAAPLAKEHAHTAAPAHSHPTHRRNRKARRRSRATAWAVLAAAHAFTLA